LVLLLMGSALRAQSIDMQYVTVGNPGNAPDPATGHQYGEVDYTFDIGEYDVTDSQYCTFLNAVDPSGANTLSLYDSSANNAEYGISLNSGAANGSKYSVISGYANMPVVDVDYWDTLRFANYLDDGNTESGAYTLLGGSTDAYGTPSNASGLLANPQPNAGATVWLPSENEWYKAGYYSPVLNSGNGGYYTYATQSNTAPGNIIGGGSNEANYSTGNGYSVTQQPYPPVSSTNYLTAVGSFTGSQSYYGTYDQSGDVANWESTPLSNTTTVLRGAGWAALSALALSSSTRSYDVPTFEYDTVGFRVASDLAPVPEPNSVMLMLAGIAGFAAIRGKRSKV
jgi:formylglycine-generating enzyme required for sulfatase activity